ncbi:MAG: YdbL family protein [Verrucomicrobia bacterium]|nr:YdbL family protein [Verrucomicrobiota bacterium]
MNPSHLLFRCLFLLVSFGLGCAVARAEDRKAVLARMEQRLAAVDELKERKLVGENHRGFLEARASLNGAQQGTVSSENSDRQALYESIAKEQRLTIDQVGRGRAQKIAAGSRRGVWLQGNDGQWYQKP